MDKMTSTRCLLIMLLAAIAVSASAQSTREKSIQEIISAELAFAKMAADKGLQAAFVFYAAEDAVIKRGNDSLIYGKSGIEHFYAKPVFKKASISWAPDFTDAAESGDMGYTYGKYTWQLKDNDGNIIQESKGIFHTVWKKQKDGQWRFVWD